MEVTTRKISKSQVKKLYNELIQKDIGVLERKKSDEKREEIAGIRKYNISKYSQKCRLNIYWSLFALQKCA